VALSLRSALSFGLALGLSSCMMLPISSKSYQQNHYEKRPLLTLADGKVVSLIWECGVRTSERGLQDQGCDKPLSTLLVRPQEWDMQEEIEQRFGDLAPDGQRLGDDIQFFGKVASGSTGSRDDSGEFIGYFVKAGRIDFVWVRPGSTGSPAVEKRIPAMQYDVVKWERPANKPSSPLLVVRDGADAWLFAERGGPCNEDLCYGVAEALGIGQKTLPPTLLHPLMLYHASLDGPNKEFERVLPSHLADYLGMAAGFLPRQEATYVFDFRSIPRSRFGSAGKEIACEIEHKTTEHLVFAGTAPLGQYAATGQSSRLLRCRARKVTEIPTDGPDFLPVPIGTLPAREHDDPRIARDGSSYYCRQNTIPGNKEFGEGKEQCHFVLHDPKTQRILPRTPYLIWLFASPTSNEVLEVKGITDAKGRTAVVRSEKPITISDLRVSRRILSPDEFSGPDGLDLPGISKRLAKLAEGVADQDRAGLYRSSPDSGRYNEFQPKKGGREGVSLQRFSDSGMVYNVPYRMELCSGAFIEDMSDDMGWTVYDDTKSAGECPVTYWSPWSPWAP
jgi:hypothetical protein